MTVIASIIQEIFRMLNQFAVEIPTLPVDQCPPHPIPEGMINRSIRMLSRREGPRQAFGTHMYIGKLFFFFANPDASSSALYPQELNPWCSRTEEPLHSSTVDKSERQTQDQDQRCQSGRSANNSVMFCGGDS